MSYDLLPTAGGSQLSPREQRRTSHAVSRLQSGGLIRQSAVDVEADVTGDKIDAITMETGHGMQAVARVAQAQTALELLVPQASGRLNLLGDGHALHMAGTLDQLNSRLRRI